MRSLAPLTVAATLVLASTPAEASGGFLPPLEIDVGAASIANAEGGATPAQELLFGVSWASLYPKATPIDVAVGVIMVSEPAPAEGAVAKGTAPTRPRAPGVDMAGGYLDLSLRIDQGRHWRAWAGVRGELGSSAGVGVLGGATRLQVELWTGVGVGDRGGIIVGALAVTGWAEVGLRELADRSVASFAAAGLGMRLPLVLVGT